MKTQAKPAAPEVTISLVRVPSQQRWRLGPVWQWRMTYEGEVLEGENDYSSIADAAGNAAGIYESRQMKARRERQLSNRAAAPPKPEKPVQFPTLEAGTLVKPPSEAFWWLPVSRDDGPAHDPARRIYLNSKHGVVWARRDRIQPFPGADAISQFDRIWKPETPPPGEDRAFAAAERERAKEVATND